MANDFSGDSSCKALWRFENGALIADSKGGNTLTDNNTVGTDTGDFKEGSACADLERTNNEHFSITDANLDSGFPLKNGDTVKKISVCFWIKIEAISQTQYLFSKSDGVTNKRSFGVNLDSTRHIRVLNGWNGGLSFTLIPHSSSLVIGQWYHVGITHDGVAKTGLIRIWDDNASAILGTDKVISWPNNTNVEDAPVNIGTVNSGSSTFAFDGKLDEMPVFDRVLSASEIDEIRSGTFGDSILPNKLVLPLSNNTVSFLGKKINSGAVNTIAGSAVINNSGQDGKNGVVDTLTEIDTIDILGQIGKSGFVEASAGSAIINNFGHDGKSGFIALDLQVVVKLLGLEAVIIFTGVLNSQLMDNIFSSSGSIGNNGNLTLQVENIISALTGFKGISGIADINVFTGTQILAKLGIKGDINILLSDLDIRMVEVSVSGRIFQILISTKTGQISILQPKAGQINITTQ